MVQHHDQISGDRRLNRRYKLEFPLRYAVSLADNRVVAGTGITHDVSTAGIAFTAEEPLPVGCAAELRVKWPVQIDQQGALELCVLGTIVHCDQRLAGMQIRVHRFITQPKTSRVGSLTNIEFDMPEPGNSEPN